MTTYAHITEWGKYLPGVVLTNDDLAEIVDTSDEWIVAHTGIKERHIATGEETVVYMSAAASRDALAEAAEQGRLAEGDHVLLVGFGTGLAWATTVIQWGAFAGQEPRHGPRRKALCMRESTASKILNAKLALYDASARFRRRPKKKGRRT